MKTKDYDYRAIGQRIRDARKKSRITQEELAEKAGVGNQHISDIERGLTGMSVGTLIDICSALGADANYILFGITAVKGALPFARLLDGLSHSQIMYAEKILEMYAKGCKDM
jgi:transcriptional regulator with XRE-family HTH domain